MMSTYYFLLKQFKCERQDKDRKRRERRQKGGLKWGKGEEARDSQLLEIKYKVVLFSTKNKTQGYYRCYLIEK